jgi:predicted nucleotidyltransferase
MFKKVRAFRDKDYIKTKDNLYFIIVGNIHPEDKVIGYLKYAPKHGGKSYKRAIKRYNIPDLIKTMNYLRENFPCYLCYIDAWDINFSAIPLTKIYTHFCPEIKLLDLLKSPNKDSLQNKAVRLVEFLSKKSKIPISDFGITGSILIDLHNPEYSDIDLVVYGKENSFLLKESLLTSYRDPLSPIKRLSGKKLYEWCSTKAEWYGLKIDEVYAIYDRKWNIGEFDGTLFSINPVKKDSELKEKYGTKKSKFVRMIEAYATIEDSSDSIFYPAKYSIKDVKTISGKSFRDIKELISFEGFYCDIAFPNEKVYVKGRLEEVYDVIQNETYYRIVVGSFEGKGFDTIKVIY